MLKYGFPRLKCFFFFFYHCCWVLSKGNSRVEPTATSTARRCVHARGAYIYIYAQAASHEYTLKAKNKKKKLLFFQPDHEMN